jgi:O-antigen/teichoic acid export membrane protein
MIGAAVASLIAYAVMGISTILVSRRYLKFHISFTFILKSAASAAIMTLCIWLINPESIARIMLSIFTGALIYFGILFAFKGLTRGEITFFVNLIKGSLQKIHGKKQ